jgi:hypothetical protein
MWPILVPGQVQAGLDGWGALNVECDGEDQAHRTQEIVGASPCRLGSWASWLPVRAALLALRSHRLRSCESRVYRTNREPEAWLRGSHRRELSNRLRIRTWSSFWRREALTSFALVLKQE